MPQQRKYVSKMTSVTPRPVKPEKPVLALEWKALIKRNNIKIHPSPSAAPPLEAATHPRGGATLREA